MPELRVKDPECKLSDTPGMTPLVVLVESALGCEEALVFTAGGFAALVVGCAGGFAEGLDAEVCFDGATVGEDDGWLAEVVCFAGALLEWLALLADVFVGGEVVGEELGRGLEGVDVGAGRGGWDRLSSAPTSPACVSRFVIDVSDAASVR